MGKTIVEKIFSKKAGKDVEPGDIIEVEVDYVMVNDITGYPAIREFEKLGVKPKIDKIIIIPDHFVPNKDIKSAEQAKTLRNFVKKYKIKHYFEVGRNGICHQIMIEKGFVAPGRLIVGADSHTCTYGALNCLGIGIGSTEAAVVFATGKLWFKVPETFKFLIKGTPRKYVMGKDIILKIISEIGVDGANYKAMEFHGDTIRKLNLSDRLTITNMSVEAGAKAAIMEPDEKVFNYLKYRTIGNYEAVYADRDAEYEKVFELDVSNLEPLVAKPFSPGNVVPVRELSDIEIDQAFIGSCTNGRIEDLRIAAKILKGKKVRDYVRLIVIPASQEVYQKALEEGLIKIFLEAGAYVSGPTCGPCLGGHVGVLASDEVCISSTNRNFIGRMGHKNSKVYLANPAVVAASAITGRITDPRDLDRD